MSLERINPQGLEEFPSYNVTFSIDFDGVINNYRLMQYYTERDQPERNTYLPDPIPENKLEEANPELLEKIVKKANKPGLNQLKILIGSNRQHKNIDTHNGENKSRSGQRIVKSGSCFPVYQQLCNIVNRTLGSNKCSLDPFLLPDVYYNRQIGSYLQSVLQNTDDDRHHRRHEPVKDESKISLLYAQAHYLATTKPDEFHELNFIDDLDVDILHKLRDFYTAHPEMLPSNVKLVLRHWTHNGGWKKLEPIFGIGPIDYNYNESMHWIAENCVDNEHRGIAHRLEEQIYNRQKTGVYTVDPKTYLNVEEFLRCRSERDIANVRAMSPNLRFIFSDAIKAAGKVSEEMRVSDEMRISVVNLADKLQTHVDSLESNKEKEQFIKNYVIPTATKTKNFANYLLLPNKSKQEKLQAARKYEDEVKSSTSNWRLFGRVIACVIGAGVGFVLGVATGAIIAGGVGVLVSGPGGIVTAVYGAIVGGKAGLSLGATVASAIIGETIIGAAAGTGLGFFATRNKQFDNQFNAIASAGKMASKAEQRVPLLPPGTRF